MDAIALRRTYADSGASKAIRTRMGCRGRNQNETKLHRILLHLETELTKPPPNEVRPTLALKTRPMCRKKLVLSIEDALSLRQLIRYSLEVDGIEVVSGEQGLELARTPPVDLMIGPGLARYLRHGSSQDHHRQRHVAQHTHHRAHSLARQCRCPGGPQLRCNGLSGQTLQPAGNDLSGERSDGLKVRGSVFFETSFPHFFAAVPTVHTNP